MNFSSGKVFTDFAFSNYAYRIGGTFKRLVNAGINM